ncbi:hypothetical protein Peur_074297 [Populus x canadensis]
MMRSISTNTCFAPRCKHAVEKVKIEQEINHLKIRRDVQVSTLRLSPCDLFLRCMMGRLAGMTFLRFANVFLGSLPVSVPPMCYNLSIFLHVLPRFRNF